MSLPERIPLLLASRGSVLRVDGSRTFLVGERINGTRQPVGDALRAGDWSLVRREAVRQVEAGADALDINVDALDVDGPSAMERAVIEVQGVVDVPLVIDSSDPETLSAGLKQVAGRPLMSSSTGKLEDFEIKLPAAKRYGAAVVGLCFDDEGIPETVEGRVEVARAILDACLSRGLRRQDLVIDALTMTVGADPAAPRVTLEAVRRIRDELGVWTLLGVSNVGFGLPNRRVLNDALLPAAILAGLDLALLDPHHSLYSLRAGDLLAGRDPDATRYTRLPKLSVKGPATKAAASGDASGAATLPAASSSIARVKHAVMTGDRDGIVPPTIRAIDESGALEVINQGIVPGLQDVGDRFGRGEVYLPQVMASAGAVKAAFELIRERLPRGQASSSGRVVLATVYGDMHDIGKNIVKAMLENFGFEVNDLGKNVPVQDVVEAARDADIVGLSALMTTTMPAMGKTIRAMREQGLGARVIVGGAVVTPRYARDIGADGHGRDAVEAVELCQRLMTEIRASEPVGSAS